jgi:hypothetical protein
MSDITTTITFTLTHSRKLTEAELKNLVGNLTEHIFEERRGDEGDWGFQAITNVHVASMHLVDGKVVLAGRNASWGSLWGGPDAHAVPEPVCGKPDPAA